MQLPSRIHQPGGGFSQTQPPNSVCFSSWPGALQLWQVTVTHSTGEVASSGMSRLPIGLYPCPTLAVTFWTSLSFPDRFRSFRAFQRSQRA